VAGRASIVGAAVTHVGKVRDHNEDAHFFDADAGLLIVCDGMGGHAAGEVASALAVRTIRGQWLDEQVGQLAEAWLKERTAEAKKQLFEALRAGVIAAHDLILAEGEEDDAKSGMGTTVVGAILVGSELVFAHAGDSRAYIVRDGIAMQLTEDHTLLARLLAAGIDVDVSGEGARFRSMLTNALGIGQDCKVATFVVPLADGDRFLLCSDGISEYVPEAEVGTVLTKQASPARAAEELVELALARGGGDNATALVIRVVEAGEAPQHLRHDDEAIRSCPLWSTKVTPQQRLRALRIAIPRDHGAGDRIPAHTLGDRVAWIVLEGALSYGGREIGPGALLYPESLVSEVSAFECEVLVVAKSDVRALALRADDFRELCDDDSELGEALLETVGALVAGPRRAGRITRGHERPDTEIERRPPSNSDVIEPPPPVMAPLPISRPAPAAQQQGQAQGRPGPRTAPPHPPPGGAQAQRPAGSGTPPSGSPVSGQGERPSSPNLQPRTTPPHPPPRPRSTPLPFPVVDPMATDRDDGDDDLDDAVEADATETDATLTNAYDPDPATSPRIRRAPSEPEIETFYELDAEPPPVAEPFSADDDDPIAEMIISVDDESGRITKTTETNEATVILTLTELDDVEDEEPTRFEAVAASEIRSVSGTISIPDRDPPPASPSPQPRRAKRVSEGRD
jgi:serine/threonine protein phosphatase PrpC